MGLKCRNRTEFIEFISSFGICVFIDVYVVYIINIEYVKYKLKPEMSPS